jgi:hypothetical protein
VLGVLSAFDFLDSREKAIVIWAVMLIGFAAYKSDALGSLGAVLQHLPDEARVPVRRGWGLCAALVLAANKVVQRCCSNHRACRTSRKPSPVTTEAGREYDASGDYELVAPAAGCIGSLHVSPGSMPVERGRRCVRLDGAVSPRPARIPLSA